MAAIYQKPTVDYFALSTKKPRYISNTSSNVWDSSPSKYSINLPSPESIHSFVPSPASLTSPTIEYPICNLPKTEDAKDQVFNFESFDDWMGWDDPADNALSSTDFVPELTTERMSPKIADIEIRPMSRGINPASIQNGSEDSAIFKDDLMMEAALFQTSSATKQPPQALYSTPLSWSTPSAGTRILSRLSAEEESKLRSIAMPSLSKARTQSQSQYPTSPSTDSSEEPTHNQRKRKPSYDEDEDEDEDEDDEDRRTSSSNGRHPPVKKTAHNMIEKRYRTNLNDKIIALRDSVPSLRIISRKDSRGEGVQEDLQGLTPAHKLNKATVLSKATEYIAHLEKRNKTLMRENTTLKSRVEAFEILMLARQTSNQKPTAGHQIPRPSNQGMAWM